MLLQLPDEILWHISRELEDQHDRLHLATSCQRLYGTLRSTIFWEVALCTYLPESLDEIDQVCQFLYTIVRDPKLASMVHVLDLGCWQTKSTRDDEGSPDDFDFDRDLMENLVREATSDGDYREQWLEDLAAGVTDAWLALLIPRLTNLCEISFVWPSGADYFPAMRYLGGFRVYESSIDEDRGEDDELDKKLSVKIDPGSSSITDIVVKVCDAADGMHAWIRGCKALTSFRLTMDSLVSYAPPNKRKLYKALSVHKAVLEAISISNVPDSIEDESTDSFMGPFADFSALKVLHVACADIVGLDNEKRPMRSLSDVLPSSLETLSLCVLDGDLFGWVIKQCELLLDSNVCPQLESIRLESRAISDPTEALKAKELKRRCQDEGISFRTFDVERWEVERKVMRYWDSVWPIDHVFDL
ncbi:uncharacterized protein N7482_000431 [Penicillium canariense]|uniref:Leucine-rich repeat domain-containing protein n=1 Tax=Penicillium canariense TaxID=189055 RepID=A0A9W9IE59_9EURO|nr:uncharacterized protein N7482_000431 [Penicillium canariense]KAJ5174554.1 hypothetical protein N7482_000431 [Penicillium canariense]